MSQYQMARNLSQDAFDARGIASQIVTGDRKLNDDELLYFLKANYLPMISACEFSLGTYRETLSASLITCSIR